MIQTRAPAGNSYGNAVLSGVVSRRGMRFQVILPFKCLYMSRVFIGFSKLSWFVVWDDFLILAVLNSF